jgi:ribosome-associated translation inhibitor RaiA
MLHLEISYSGTDRSDALDAHVRTQVERDCKHFLDRLTRIEVHVGDGNGGKHGKADKRCVLEARPRGMDPIAVTEDGDDLYLVVTEASRKLARAVGKRFEKADAAA